MMNILTHLFYLSTIIYMMNEVRWLFNIDEEVNNVNRFIELSKENKWKPSKEVSEEYKKMINDNWDVIFIFFWMFVGLFTAQWHFFLMIIAFNLFVIAPLSHLTRYTKTYKVIHWINSLIGFIFCIFVIINHYHLHINI